MERDKNPVEPSRPSRSRNLARALGFGLTSWGAISLIFSYIYSSSILTMTGLGLVFWGAIIVYIRTDEYVKKKLLDASAEPSLTTIARMVHELDYKGGVFYLPPAFFKDPQATKVFIARTGDGIPNPELTQIDENRIFLEQRNGLLIESPGAKLSKLFEEVLNANFTNKDLKYIQQNLPRLFAEDLEIAQELEIKEEGNKLIFRLENCIYKNSSEKNQHSAETQTMIGSPIASAIGSVLAKATGMPVRIVTEQEIDDKNTLEIVYETIHSGRS